MAVTQLTDGARTAAAPPGERVLRATITCLGRWGLAKTTLDDIAREAGTSRATVYRLFPGGKDTVVKAAVAAELERFATGLRKELAQADGIEEVLVAALTFTTRALREHEALQFLLAHEPGQILPHLAFANFDQVLEAAAATAGPWIEPRAAEWVARLICSYALAPSEHFDLADEHDARRFARTFLLPGIDTGKGHPHG